MRFFGALLALSGIAVSSTVVYGQPTTLVQMLLQASQAFSATGAATSIVLSGNVTRYAGSDTENGTITLTASADGSSNIQMQLNSGQATESRDTFANGSGCSWSGPDGVSHVTAGQNCIVSLAWFLPEVALFSASLPANGTFSLSPNSTAGATTLHWAMSPVASATGDVSALLTHIGVYDLTLDGTTFLPATLSFAAHPDANAGVDIPVVVQYSDYQTVNGTTLPYHIQRYFNGVLSLDITLSNAVVTH